MREHVLLAGCGDLGLRVAQRLLARGDQVSALRRQPPADAPAGMHWLCGNLADSASLRALPVGITQLVYLPTPDRRDEAAYRTLFVEGLQRLLGALDTATLRRVLFVSSSAVYGEHGDDWVDEDTPAAPPGFNGAVLRQAEQWLAAQPFGSVILRLAGLYGPGRLQLLDRLRSGQLRVPRTQVHWANRIHVEDAAAAIAHLLSLPTPAPLYVGVDNTPLPLHVLYDALAALIQVPPPLEGPPPAGIGSKRLSNALLRASGLTLQWPDARAGYAALLATPH